MNRSRGYILFVLLIVFLFISGLLFQLKENNYFMQLVTKQFSKTIEARSILYQAFLSLSHLTEKPELCFFDSDKKSELTLFWNQNPGYCQISIMGKKVDYAFRDYKQENEEKQYLQYTLKLKTGFSEIWLRVIQDQSNGVITAYLSQLN